MSHVEVWKVINFYIEYQINCACYDSIIASILRDFFEEDLFGIKGQSKNKNQNTVTVSIINLLMLVILVF